MSANELRELAARVMPLDGPCRETDAAIAAAVHYFPKDVGYIWQGSLKPNSPEVGRVECCTDLGTGGPHYLAPRFTASLDDAMSLVPDMHRSGVLHHALLSVQRTGFPRSTFLHRLICEIVAAALLALAAQKERTDDAA